MMGLDVLLAHLISGEKLTLQDGSAHFADGLQLVVLILEGARGTLDGPWGGGAVDPPFGLASLARFVFNIVFERALGTSPEFVFFVVVVVVIPQSSASRG